MPDKKPYPFGSPRTIKRALQAARNKLNAYKKNQNTSKTKKRKHKRSEWNSNSNNNRNNNTTVKHQKTHL